MRKSALWHRRRSYVDARADGAERARWKVALIEAQCACSRQRPPAFPDTPSRKSKCTAENSRST